MEEGLNELDAEAEEKSIEEDFPESGAGIHDERAEEAEGDGHGDIEDDLASEIAMTSGDVDKGGEVHRDIRVIKDERKGGDDWHKSEIEDEGEVDIHEGIDEYDIAALGVPFAIEYEKVDEGEGGEVDDVFNKTSG